MSLLRLDIILVAIHKYLAQLPGRISGRIDRVFNSNERNCIKFGVSSQYAIINKKYYFGNDPHIFRSVIWSDMQ